MKLPLVFYPNPKLSEASVKVDDISGVQKLCSDMIDTMEHEKGIGISAVQVGKSVRCAIISKDADESLEDHLIIINPKIFSASKEMVEEEEGCLSIPEVFEMVNRHKKIKVRYTDSSGQEQKLKATNLFARVLQHEIDHMDGVLIIDRVSEITKGKLDV
tara:strand:- start:12435 stop:12911 length:477 start_codon:yes stop_codon:yes gene_type:complete